MNYWNDNVSYLNQRSVRLRTKSKSTVSIMQAKYDIAPYITQILILGTSLTLYWQKS